MQITMLVSNPFRPDPRVAREAQSLARAGYHVNILCWDRKVELPSSEIQDGYQLVRIQNVRTGYGGGAKQILHTPRFWRSALSRLHSTNPDIVHCHDLDTLPAGWWYKRKKKIKLIYDAHEDYPALMSLYLPDTFVHGLARLESHLLRDVDHTITASTVFADKLRLQGLKNVTTIGNFQSLEPFDQVSDQKIAQARTDLGIPADALTLVYIGGFSRNRALTPLLQAAHKMPDIYFLIWGDGHQRDTVVAYSQKNPNIKYFGWLPTDKISLYAQVADVIYYCLVKDYPGAIYNAPNTLAIAMAAGRPIIANNVGDLGRIVHQTGCGLLLSVVNPAAIINALDQLQDPEIRNQLGKAGRTAAESQYNWQIVERRLLQLYQSLISAA